MQALFLIAVTAAHAAASPDQLAITGTIQDEKGQVLSGAHVFISTAAPRQGVGVL